LSDVRVVLIGARLCGDRSFVGEHALLGRDKRRPRHQAGRLAQRPAIARRRPDRVGGAPGAMQGTD